MIDYIIITPFFPSINSFRGSYMLDQAKAIQSNPGLNVKVIILSSFFHKSYGNYEIEGIKCITFKLLDFPSFIFPGFFNFINQFRLKRFLFNHKIFSSNTTIFHGHINYPCSNILVYLSKIYKCKTILQHHGLDILQKNTGITLPFLKSIQNAFILNRFKRDSKKIDFHIAVSSHVKDQIIKIFPILEKNTIVSVNGVDRKKFYFDLNTQKDSSKFIIGCVANFWKLKDQMTLLKAVNILTKEGVKNIQINFVGNGETLSKCKSYANKHDLDCKFYDNIKHSKLYLFYNQIDLFVLPSFYEAFGCVYLEALACGVPFIAVKNQGIEDVIKDKHKKYQLINKESAKELSTLILYFYSKNRHIEFDEKYYIENTVKKMLHQLKIN